MGVPLTLRSAESADIPALAELWSELVRGDDHTDPHGDMAVLIAGQGEHNRVVVAEYDGVFAGAVLLTVTTISPLNLTPMVNIVSPTVVECYRRRGVGRSLIEAGVLFAEERDVTQVGTASVSTSRDANRFMARLGLATRASFRLAPTSTVRARITAMRPSMARPQRQQLGHVLAARRSMRRASASQAG